MDSNVLLEIAILPIWGGLKCVAVALTLGPKDKLVLNSTPRLRSMWSPVLLGSTHACFVDTMMSPLEFKKCGNDMALSIMEIDTYPTNLNY